jgi:hypothetical protein
MFNIEGYLKQLKKSINNKMVILRIMGEMAMYIKYILTSRP